MDGQNRKRKILFGENEYIEANNNMNNNDEPQTKKIKREEQDEVVKDTDQIIDDNTSDDDFPNDSSENYNNEDQEEEILDCEEERKSFFTGENLTNYNIAFMAFLETQRSRGKTPQDVLNDLELSTVQKTFFFPRFFRKVLTPFLLFLRMTMTTHVWCGTSSTDSADFLTHGRWSSR